MNRLLSYRLLCLVLIAQACFAIAGTLTIWRELLEPGAVLLVAGSHVALVLVAGCYYVVPTPRILGLGLAGLVALSFFLWVGLQGPEGPTAIALLGRAVALSGAWVGLHLLAPRAVEEWKLSVHGEEPRAIAETVSR